jgi:hypothetical protein
MISLHYHISRREIDSNFSELRKTLPNANYSYFVVYVDSVITRPLYLQWFVSVIARPLIIHWIANLVLDALVQTVAWRLDIDG